MENDSINTELGDSIGKNVAIQQSPTVYTTKDNDGNIIEIKELHFEKFKIRVAWLRDKEMFYFSVGDCIGFLTEQIDYQKARNYWNKLKQRLREEGNQSVTNCHRLKLRAADGKYYLTDVADTEHLLRIIQSIPSKKAEPFKQWMAHLGQERLNQMQDPELNIEQMIGDYKRLGYSDSWINQRIKTIEIRNNLTEEWKRSGISEHSDFAKLTNIIYQAWSGMNKREYMDFKGLHKESLRDNMTPVELMLNGLAEAATTEISQDRNPKGFDESALIAQEGGEVADVARQNLEHRLGRSVISKQRAINFTLPPDELPIPKSDEDSNDFEIECTINE